MEWKDVGSTIAEFAPGLAGVVGGMFGGGAVGSLASTAVGAICSALGLRADAKPDQVLEAIKSNPEAVLKLQQAEMDFKVKIGEQRITEIKAELADVASARSREIEVVKATGKKDINLYVLAWVIIGGFLGLLACLIIMQAGYGKTFENNSLLTMLLGSLSTDAGMVVGYFFGSSRSSDSKNQTIADMAWNGKH
jgi:hypothetical protein